ncbi:MAG: hypothetical protein ACE5I1_19725, partial [bacterium]
EVWQQHAWPPDDSLQHIAAVTPLDEKIAEFRIAVLRSGWPFRSGARQPLPPAREPEDELARQVAMRQLDWRSAHLRNGERLARSRKYARAAREYLAVAKVSPAYQRVWIDLGNTYGLAEQYLAAERAYEHALALKPTPALALKLATLYLTVQDVAKAKEVLRKLVAAPGAAPSQKEQAMAHYLYALVLAQTGELAQAKKHAGLAAQISPDNPNVRQLVEQLQE